METVQLKGKHLVEWRQDESVTVRSEDFTRHLWYQKDEMHIEFSRLALEI